MVVDSRVGRRGDDTDVDAAGMATEQIAQLARRASFEFAGLLAPLGFTPAQFAVIDFLFNYGGSATQADIARAVGVEQPTMAATLRRMERDSLIVRVADPSDGRQSFVSPTTSVKRKRTKLSAARRRVEAEMLAVLTETEQRELKRLLEKIQATTGVVRPRSATR